MESIRNYRPPGDPSQQRAICHFNGSCEVIAGPGSGKTFVLTEHILYLLTVRGVPPSAILVLTFSRAAAKEMKSRFFQKYRALQCTACPPASMPGSGTSGSIYASGTPVFGTVHSVFLHILNQSVPVPFKVMETARKSTLLQTILRRYETPRGEDETYHASRKPETPDLWIEYENAIARCKSGSFEDSSDLPDHFRDIFAEYTHYLNENHLLDYDDILTECLRLFRSSSNILQEWQHRFRFILFDEFQDINRVQYELVMLLKGQTGSLFAAGDDDQCIYSFRGSDPSFFVRMEEECARRGEPFEKIILCANYRSEREIIRSSDRLIRQNRHRITKRPAAKKEGGLFRIAGYENTSSQYRSILSEIISLPSSERTRTAVIFRTRQQLSHFQREMIRCLEQERTNIPRERNKIDNTDIPGRLSAIEAGAVLLPASIGLMTGPFIYPKLHSLTEDLMSYYRAASDSSSGIISRRDLLRILNKPQRYLSRELFMRESVIIREQLAQTARRSRSLARELNHLFEDIRFLACVPPQLSIDFLMYTIGYERYLHDAYPAWVAENLTDYLNLLRKEAQRIHSISAFTALLRSLCEKPETLFEGNQDENPGESPEKRHKNRLEGRHRENPTDGHEGTFREYHEGHVGENHLPYGLPRLLTMHACKGLEFDIVYLPDLNEGILPGRRCRTVTQLEEERRLLYVAMTRAVHSLHLSYVAGSVHNPRRPSRFLQVFGIKPYEL